MTISYNETKQNHTLSEFIDPLEKERARARVVRREQLKKSISKLQDQTDKDSLRLVECYRKASSLL